jgi:hypothetical protein
MAEIGWVHGDGEEVYRVRAGVVEYLGFKAGDEEEWRPAFSALAEHEELTVEHMVAEIHRLTEENARLRAELEHRMTEERAFHGDMRSALERLQATVDRLDTSG